LIRIAKLLAAVAALVAAALGQSASPAPAVLLMSIDGLRPPPPGLMAELGKKVEYGHFLMYNAHCWYLRVDRRACEVLLPESAHAEPSHLALCRN